MIETRQRTPGLFGLRPTPLGHRWQMPMSAYMDLTSLPPIPSGAFGHMAMVDKPWGMYLNDQLGDCVVAGKQHCLRLWVAEGTGSDTLVFDDACTIKNYELLGHYQPGNPESDQGCDMLFAAEMWMKHGIWDAAGNIHKIGLALELDCGPGYLNMDQFWYAAYLFDGLGLGIAVTDDMQADFADGIPWSAQSYNPSRVIGGHFVPAMAREVANLHGTSSLETDVISWDAVQPITIDGLQAITTTVLVYCSAEKLRDGKDMEGLSWSDMRSDARKVTKLGALRGIHRL